MTFTLVLIAAIGFGFAVGRWWVVVPGAAAWAVWDYYDSQRSHIHLEGNLDLFLSVLTTSLVAAAILAGVVLRWTGRAWARRRSRTPEGSH